MFNRRTTGSGPAGMTLLGLAKPGPARNATLEVEATSPSVLPPDESLPPADSQLRREAAIDYDEPGMSVLGLSELDYLAPLQESAPASESVVEAVPVASPPPQPTEVFADSLPAGKNEHVPADHLP